jgi:transposase
MARRHELTDEQWARLAPLLPPQKPATGRPNHDHRTVLNGIPWRLKTGSPWRDLPERYGRWETVYGRFRRWQRAGVWARVLAALQADGDARGEADGDARGEADGDARGDLDWALHFVDGTTVRAHPPAAGAARKGGPPPNRPTTPSAAARAASRPRSTSGPRAAASRSASP